MSADFMHTDEAALLGIVMHDATAMDDITLTGDDFADPRLGAVWDLARRMRTDGKPCDPATLGANLHRIDAVVEMATLVDVYTAAPVPSLAEHYAGLVSDAATRRRLRLAAASITQATESDLSAAEVVEQARAWVDGTVRITGGLHLMADDLGATIDALSSPEPPAIPTPWDDLNHVIGGWRPGALYVVGARPGVGKSLFALGAALGLARHGGVAWSSLEMPSSEVHARALAATSGVFLNKIIDRRLTEVDWDAIAVATKRLAALPISIDGRGGVTTTDVRAHARTLHRRHPLAAVVVDYIQLLSAPRGDRRDRHVIVGEQSRALKMLAMEMGVPVIALSQLNRASTARADKSPSMEDLRESGSLEQDSDVVILLHTTEAAPGELQVHVPKNRHGQADVRLTLARRGHLARLDNAGWTPSIAGGAA